MSKEFLNRLRRGLKETAQDVGVIVGSAVTGAIPGGPKGYAQYVGEIYDRGLIQKEDLDTLDVMEFGKWVGVLGIIVARGDLIMAGLWYELVGTAATLMTNVRLRQHIDRNSRLNPKPPTTATP